MMANQTIEQLLAPRLQAMAGEYRRQREMPAMNPLDFDTRLGMITDAEWIARNNQRSKKLMKEAGLCVSNALFGDLDYQPARKLNKAQVARLSDFAWSREAKNIIITGATGTGISYLACAFGAEACRMGIRVKYHRTSLLLTELCAAYSDNRLNDILRRLNKADILILDDWGLSSINTLQARALLEVFENRIGAKSCVIAAQPPVAKWFELFEDATIADAVMDRLVYSSYRFDLHGPSLRRRYGLRAEEAAEEIESLRD
jgi:DNA replication protein DnaC